MCLECDEAALEDQELPIESDSVAVDHDNNPTSFDADHDTTTSSCQQVPDNKKQAEIVSEVCPPQTMILSTSLYLGVKLDLDCILAQYPELEAYHALKNSRKRTHVRCKTCEEYIQEAKKFSKNGLVPIANGIRADGDDRLKLIIDHVQSEVHKAALQRQKMDIEWSKGSDKHPWLKVLKAHNAQVVRLLVRMAYDVYNDCLCETVSANSWPSRSLTTLAADRLVAVMADEGSDAALQRFSPPASELHYRDSVYYKQMLDSINAVEYERISKMFSTCIAFSIQIDGSVCKQMVDNKFTSCRMATSDGCLKTIFLKMHSPDESGAKGLLEAVNESLLICGDNVDKLMGITTDGESANTGVNNGLWKLLSDQLKRGILTFWCCAQIRFGIRSNNSCRSRT